MNSCIRCDRCKRHDPNCTFTLAQHDYPNLASPRTRYRLRVYRFPQRVPTLPSATADRQIHSPLVRWVAGGVDNLHACLSNSAVCGIRVRSYDNGVATTAPANRVAHLVVAGCNLHVADRARRELETDEQRYAGAAHHVADAGMRGLALLYPVNDWTTRAELVQSHARGAVALPAVFVVQYQFVAGADQLSVGGRAEFLGVHTVVDLVVRFHLVRQPLCLRENPDARRSVVRKSRYERELNSRD